MDKKPLEAAVPTLDKGNLPSGIEEIIKGSKKVLELKPCYSSSDKILDHYRVVMAVDPKNIIARCPTFENDGWIYASSDDIVATLQKISGEGNVAERYIGVRETKEGKDAKYYTLKIYEVRREQHDKRKNRHCSV